MSKNVARISRFRQRAKYINGILTTFEDAGFSIESVYDEENHPHSWGAILLPTEDLSQELGSRSELLLWVDAFDQFQSRSIERIRGALAAARPRLREDIAFLVSRDQKVAGSVASLHSETTIIPYSEDQLRDFHSPSGPNFRRHLVARVFSHDPYRLTGAIVQQWQFFGRTRLIIESVAAANAGRRIGLFGLRKIGKTSLLLRIIHQLRLASDNMIVAHLQVARIDAIRRSANYFLWSLGQAIYHSIPKVIKLPSFRIFGRQGIFSDLSPAETDAIPESFLLDVENLLRKPHLRLCFVFDEIERMWPSTNEPSTSQWATEFPKIWQLLRSLDQEYPGRISLIAAGTNPECVEKAKIGNRDNPLFQYMQVSYLPFLERDDAYALLKDLGARGGLAWTDDACRLAYEQVAGLPALLRVLGSAVYADGSVHERRRLLAESNVTDVTAATRRESTPILNEICGALKESYPDDYMLLECLALNRIGEFTQFSEIFPDAIQHLHGFGLLHQGALPSLSFSLLQSHIQSMGKSRPQGPPLNSLPDVIASNKIIFSLGRTGGFGRVFKCRTLRGEDVAIKLLHSSSLSALNREVDILKEINHENIVRFLDSGHDAIGNYIIMEYLEGAPWSRHCSRASRIDPRDIKQDLIKLLRALHYIHPKGVAIQPIADELSLQEILAGKIGYIHRDIKPENIIAVKKRGPILIDFGIASKAGDPTKTTSATPGYLPPDFVAGAWDPDIDLFQLGLTMLQVLVGETYTGQLTQLQDLRSVFDNDSTISKQIKHTVLKMCEPERQGRFKSASDILSFLGI